MPVYSPEDALDLIWGGHVDIVSGTVSGASGSAVMRLDEKSVALTTDNKTVSTVQLPISFFNSLDPSEWAADNVTADLGCPEFDPAVHPVTVFENGMTLENVKSFVVYTVATSPASSSQFLYFDLVVRNSDGEALVYYCHPNHNGLGEKGPIICHSGDRRDDPVLRHSVEVGSMEQSTSTECGPFLFQVHGYSSAPLANFTDQKNLVKATMADGSVRFLMVPWNLSRAALPQSALTAHWMAAVCNPDRTYTLVSCFRAGLTGDASYNTGIECDGAKRDCDNYHAAIRRTVTENAIPPTIQPTITPELKRLEGPVFFAAMMHSHATCADIPQGVIDLCTAFNIDTTPKRLTHGIFGPTNPGIDNLAVMPTVHAPADSSEVHVIFVPQTNAHQFDKKLNLVRHKARCIIIFEDATNICFYAAAVANARSTLLVLRDGAFIPVYGVLPPDMDKHMYTSGVDLHELMEWHRADNALERSEPDVPHFDQFEAAVTSDRWVDALMRLFLAASPEDWADRRRAYTSYLEKRVKESPELQIPENRKLSESEKKAFRAGIALRRVWRDKLRVFVTRFWTHPLEAATLSVAAKLNCDPQAWVRKTLSEQQHAEFEGGLSLDRVSTLLEELEHANGSDLEFMMVDITSGIPDIGAFDMFAVAACWNASRAGTGLACRLPARGDASFLPVPVLSTTFARTFNPSTGFHDTANDALYSLLMWSSAALGCVGRHPKSAEAMSNLALFYQRAFRQCTKALSSAYAPDPEQTTTAYLQSLRLLAFAIFGGTSGAAGGGMLYPDITRYYVGAPPHSIPAKRTAFDKFPDFITDNAWIPWAFTSAQITNNSGLAERVLRTFWGDCLKQLWVTFIAPYTPKLDSYKKSSESARLKCAFDRSNCTLLYQLVLILVGTGACGNTVTVEEAVRAVFSCSLDELRGSINRNSAICTGHHRSTALLERCDVDSPHWLSIVAKRFAPWFGRKGTEAIIEGGTELATRCVMELVTAPNPAKSLKKLLGMKIMTPCMPFRADNTPLPLDKIKELVANRHIDSVDPDSSLATTPQPLELPNESIPPCLRSVIDNTPDHTFDPPPGLARMGISVPRSFIKRLVKVLAEHWNNIDAGVRAGFELLDTERLFLHSTL